MFFDEEYVCGVVSNLSLLKHSLLTTFMSKAIMFPRIFEKLDLGPSYGNAWATLRYDSGQEACLELIFGSARIKNKILRLSSSPNALQPVGFNSAISTNSLAYAIKWTLDLDAYDKQYYFDNLIITKKIPLIPPKRTTSFAKPLTSNDYWNQRLPSEALIRPIFLTSPSRKKLFKYQKKGSDWLLENKKAILADDMGLGKTVQTIDALSHLFNNAEIRSALIICPKILIANWESELTEWAPQLSWIRVIPTSAERNQSWAAIFNRTHILITNYEQLRNPISELSSFGVGIVIADEVHRIRKLSSNTTKGVRNLKYERFWALSGTPIENDTEDLATILSTMEPKRFAPSDGKLEASILRARSRPYILRRNKKDVLPQLPDVIEITEIIELYKPQWKSYKNAIRKTSSNTSKSKSLVVLINELRTICDYDEKSGMSSKIDRIVQLCQDICKLGEKAVIFSYLLKPLYLLSERLTEQLGISSHLIIEGAMTIEERDKTIVSFKQNPKVSILLASSRVAGEGLTLTEANHVIFLNEWWNPSANSQARDRIVRIGQKRAVSVYKFICKGTIEESLQRILKEKGKTYYEIIDKLAEGRDEGKLSSQLINEIKADLLHST